MILLVHASPDLGSIHLRFQFPPTFGPFSSKPIFCGRSSSFAMKIDVARGTSSLLDNVDNCWAEIVVKKR